MEVNFLNKNPSWPRVFQFGIFFVLFWVNRCVFPPSVLLRVLLTRLLLAANPFGFSVMFSWLLYLAPKFFCFPCIQLLVCLCAIFPYLLVEFFRCFGMSCFVCIILPISFKSFFFRPDFLANFHELYCHFHLCCFAFLSRRLPVFFLCFISFPCCRRFLRFQSNFQCRFWVSFRVL